VRQVAGAANTGGGGGGGNGARNKEQADLPFLHVMWEWEMQERHFQHILRKKIILILVTFWSGRLRAGYSRLQIEPLKVGRDATYFTFDLTQHSVRRFTPLVSAWHYNSVYDMAEKTFCFQIV
jgi:hypothetical protein